MIAVIVSLLFKLLWVGGGAHGAEAWTTDSKHSQLPRETLGIDAGSKDSHGILTMLKTYKVTSNKIL